MLGLAGMLVLAVGATEVSLSVSPGTPCVTEPPLRRRLKLAGLKVLEQPGAASLNVTLSAKEGSLLVSAQRGALRFERRVPASAGDCRAVERVTFALINAWAAKPEREERSSRAESGDATVPEVSTDRSPGAESKAATVPALDSDRSSRAESRDATAPEVSTDRSSRAESRDATEVSTDRSLRAESRDATVPALGSDRSSRAESRDATVSALAPDRSSQAESRDATEVSTDRSSRAESRDATVPALDSAPVTTARYERSIEVAALGGFSAGASDDVTGAGSLLGGVSWGRWGALLELGLESEHANRVEPAGVSASMQWLAVSLRVAFQLHQSLTLDLALGARGWRIAARATGVDIATDQVAFAAGPTLSAGLSLHLIGPLFLHLRPSVGVRVQQVSFSVEPLGRVLLIDRVSAGATLGALLRFE